MESFFERLMNTAIKLRIFLFRSNNGILINADVNAAYQMMKLGSTRTIPIKAGEQITRIKAA